MLYDSRSVLMVLGNLMSNPELIISNDFELISDDFIERFHRIIFTSIKKLYSTGITEITPAEIDCFVANYKEQHDIFQKNKGYEWLETAQQIATKSNYDYHVSRIKKFTLLRKLQKENFNIEEIYDTNDEQKVKQFDDLAIEDIINHYNKKLIEIEKTTLKIEGGSHISDGIDELLDELGKNPTMGLSSGINSLDYFTYGIRKKYYVISAKTGEGKTRLQSHICLQLGYYQMTPTLFISTELNKDEVQTMVISGISGIDERKILLHDLTKTEKDKVEWAKEELKKSKIEIVYLPDFNVDNVEHVIKRYILTHKIQFVIFDYIKESISMMEAMNKKLGKIDGWKSLMLFSERLKSLCEKYHVGIITATQLARDGMTQGSMAIPNTCDVWWKLRFATEEEKKKYNLIDFDKDGEILCIDTEKNRRGMKNFQVFLECNLGKLQFDELVTIKNGNIIKVPKIEFQ